MTPVSQINGSGGEVALAAPPAASAPSPSTRKPTAAAVVAALVSAAVGVLGLTGVTHANPTDAAAVGGGTIGFAGALIALVHIHLRASEIKAWLVRAAQMAEQAKAGLGHLIVHTESATSGASATKDPEMAKQLDALWQRFTYLAGTVRSSTGAQLANTESWLADELAHVHQHMESLLAGLQLEPGELALLQKFNRDPGQFSGHDLESLVPTVTKVLSYLETSAARAERATQAAQAPAASPAPMPEPSANEIVVDPANLTVTGPPPGEAVAAEQAQVAEQTPSPSTGGAS